jgi:hypothetical protein
MSCTCRPSCPWPTPKPGFRQRSLGCPATHFVLSACLLHEITYYVVYDTCRPWCPWLIPKPVLNQLCSVLLNLLCSISTCRAHLYLHALHPQALVSLAQRLQALGSSAGLEGLLMREASYRCIGEGYTHVAPHVSFSAWWVRVMLALHPWRHWHVRHCITISPVCTQSSAQVCRAGYWFARALS